VTSSPSGFSPSTVTVEGRSAELNHPWVDKGQSTDTIFVGTSDIHDNDPVGDPDLGGRQPHTLGMVHRLEHVLDEVPDSIARLSYRLSGLPKDRISEDSDFP